MLQVFQWNGELPKEIQPNLICTLRASEKTMQGPGVEWAWESEQQSTFEAIKGVIMTLPVLVYFDKTKKTHNPMRCLQERAWCSLTIGV